MDGFSLSVASYVVKVKVWKFNYKRMCKNQRKSWPFLRKRPTFVELLTRFELVTSSLPSDRKPESCWCSAVSGPFCPGKMILSILSAPLPPSASFPVWVRLWVKLSQDAKEGRTSDSGSPSRTARSRS